MACLGSSSLFVHLKCNQYITAEPQILCSLSCIEVEDSLPSHVAEFDSFRLSAKEYVDRYYIGHYTPRGNHFFAYANKDAIRNWLNPPPPAYQNNQEPLIRFKGYLPG